MNILALISAIALAAVVLPEPGGLTTHKYKLIKDEIYTIKTNFFKLSEFSKKYFSYLSLSLLSIFFLFSSINSFKNTLLIFSLICIFSVSSLNSISKTVFIISSSVILASSYLVCCNIFLNLFIP